MAAGAPKAVEVAAPGCAPKSPVPVAAAGAMGFAPNRLLGCDVAAAPKPVVAAAGAPKDEAPKAVPVRRLKDDLLRLLCRLLFRKIGQKRGLTLTNRRN